MESYKEQSGNQIATQSRVAIQGRVARAKPKRVRKYRTILR